MSKIARQNRQYAFFQSFPYIMRLNYDSLLLPFYHAKSSIILLLLTSDKFTRQRKPLGRKESQLYSVSILMYLQQLQS